MRQAGIDVKAVTGGRFEARTDGGAEPTSIVTADGVTTVRRQRGRDTVIESAHDGLGAIALVRSDGVVLGYGTMATIEEISALADDVDVAMGAPTEGGPLERLALHGMHLILPFDEMPTQIRDLLLEHRIPDDFLEVAAVTDEAIAGIHETYGGEDGDACDADHRDGHHHHGHDHPECAASGPDGIAGANDRIDAIIEERGHAVIATSNPGGTLAYTVGLAEIGWPELVLTGLPCETSVLVLNDAVDELRERGRAASAGETLTRTANVPLRVRAMELRPASVLTVAASRLRRSDIDPAHLRALQLTWPDPSGKHPDQTGYDRRYAQQVLI